MLLWLLRLLLLLLTLLTFVLVVTLDVFGQMIRAHESSLTDGTDKLLLSGVGSFVAGQLVGAGEPTATVWPLANEGPFAGVNALMSLQVTGFEVVFATVRVFALVDSSAFWFLGSGWGRNGSSTGRLRDQKCFAVGLTE